MNCENSGLSEREKRFCFSYVESGNLKEAAIAAGFEIPTQQAYKLLAREAVQLELERLYEQKKKTLMYKAYCGFERLAFGSVADAIRLLNCPETDAQEIAKMDLFCISEIKKPKDGSMEIKFFDRLKALEKLLQADNTEHKQNSSFFQALSDAAGKS